MSQRTETERPEILEMVKVKEKGNCEEGNGKLMKAKASERMREVDKTKSGRQPASE